MRGTSAKSTRKIIATIRKMVRGRRVKRPKAARIAPPISIPTKLKLATNPTVSGWLEVENK